MGYHCSGGRLVRVEHEGAMVTFDELPEGAWFTFDEDYPIGDEPVRLYQKRWTGQRHIAWSEDIRIGHITRRDSEVTEHERRG